MSITAQEIKSLLEKTEGISDFRIHTVQTESTELFFVHKTLETVRSTDTADTKVTVFVTHDGKLGDATFSVYASYDEAKLLAEIEAAKQRALLVDNQPYELPAGESAAFESDSNLGRGNVGAMAAAVSDAVFAADRYEGGAINALEVFVYRDTVRVLNSRGVDKTEVKYRAMVEAIPTWNGAEESVELYECHNFTEFDAAAVTAEIDGKMREVRDRLLAKKPAEKPQCRVVLTAPELETLFGDLAFELNFNKIYNHSNAFSVGDAVQKEPCGDALTLTMCGRMTGSVRSAAFDSDGVTLADTKVIDGGRAVAAFGGVRYASYLGEKPTGDLRCMHVERGTLSDAELASAPYFKCVSMSGLQLDIYSDYIGGEVRLGYYFDGTREIPVTGISISGKLSDALTSMRLSDTETVYEGYRGPKLACFEGIEVV